MVAGARPARRQSLDYVNGIGNPNGGIPQIARETDQMSDGFRPKTGSKPQKRSRNRNANVVQNTNIAGPPSPANSNVIVNVNG